MSTTTALPTLPDPLRVAVTAAHIAWGERESCQNCPVALAVLAALHAARSRNWLTVTVDDLGLYVDVVGGGEWDARLPDEAHAFMTDFDAGRPVAPFAFEVTEWGPSDGEG